MVLIMGLAPAPAMSSHGSAYGDCPGLEIGSGHCLRQAARRTAKRCHETGAQGYLGLIRVLMSKCGSDPQYRILRVLPMVKDAGTLMSG